jgi:DNA-binding transcriptional regulator YiaG
LNISVALVIVSLLSFPFVTALILGLPETPAIIIFGIREKVLTRPQGLPRMRSTMKAKEITAARLRRKHSFADAASEIGVTEATVRNWERTGPGTKTPEIMLRALREYVAASKAQEA